MYHARHHSDNGEAFDVTIMTTAGTDSDPRPGLTSLMDY